MATTLVTAPGATGLAPIIAEHGPPVGLLPTDTDTAFGALARSIIYQQLATGAARAIFLRVVAACRVRGKLRTCLCYQTTLGAYKQAHNAIWHIVCNL